MSVDVRVGSRLALLVREHGDQPPVARVEVEVAFRLVVEVGLLKDEWHPEHALPEVDRRLAVRPDERDVVDALALQLPHGGADFLTGRSRRVRNNLGLTLDVTRA
jgi:hypothetical protein